MTPPGGPVRVMHVMFSLQPGGMEHGVVKLVNGLDPARVGSAICATTPGGALRPLVSPGVPVFELRRRKGNDPALVWRLYRLFRRERPHVVHTHAWGTLVEGLIAARLARVPLVIHGEHGTLQLKRYQARVQRWAWGHVDRLLAVSSRLSERMARETGFPVESIQVIRNGVDLSRFASTDRQEARRALGLADADVAIGTAGRLVPVKDQATLLEAFAGLQRAGAPFVGLIAGDGPLRASLEARAAAMDLGARVRFLGHRPDVERVFAALDVFVLSSVSEGLSNTILEAMASGVAVVATRVGGADELVEDGRTGTLIPARDTAALTEAILGLCNRASVRLAFGRAGRVRAQSVFGLPRMIESYQAAYLDAFASLDGMGNGARDGTAASRPSIRSQVLR